MAKSKTKKPRSVGPEDFLGGGVTGHDIELARELLLRAGYRIGIEVSPYAELMPGLDEDRWDLVAATTGITPERAAKYLFSEPYFETCQAVLVRAGTGEPLALEDLRGRRVGAAGDGTSARAVQGLTDRFGVAGVRLGKGQAGVPALLDGEIDALVVDEFEAVTAAREDADRLHVMSEPAALEHYGFVMRKGDLGLKEVVDHGLLEMRRDGSLAKLRAFYKVERDEDWPIVGMRPEVD
jgi:polar amino acid transport system substrate-binding protein